MEKEVENKVDRLLETKTHMIKTQLKKQEKKLPRRLVLLGVLIACCSLASAVVVNSLLSNQITAIVTFDPPPVHSLVFEQSNDAGQSWTQDAISLTPADQITTYQARVTNNQDTPVNSKLQMTVTCTTGFTVVDGVITDITAILIVFDGFQENLLTSSYFTWSLNPTNDILTITTLNSYPIPVGISPSLNGVSVITTFVEGATGTYSFIIEGIA
jgi:hypothetical protein